MIYVFPENEKKQKVPGGAPIADENLNICKSSIFGY
jgi:hypothetical protein